MPGKRKREVEGPLILKAIGHEQGTYFWIKVQPGAGRTAVMGIWEGILKMKVGKAPERGAANRECLDFLAKQLQLPKSSLSIVKGETSRLKQVWVDRLSPQEVEQRLWNEK